jgi:demethylmenaquinone methyltransferase / 2-methoxy-6-polyprenyl-1,4-benzoquinol methylase
VDREELTHFGFETVKAVEKAPRVAAVFDSVARRYDIMNDVMSAGIHRLWKRYTIEAAAPRPGQSILDIAGGTGDLTQQFARRVGPQGSVVLADINFNMLAVGREKLLNAGLAEPIEYVQADAEQLPFADNRFDCITIAFGLRNVTDKNRALASMLRVLKPGGRLLVLEFSKPVSSTLAKLYDHYSFRLLPKMGRLIASDEASYRYLAESIRQHPDQETLANMMTQVGFDRVSYLNMTGGIVALHTGYKT